MAEIIEFDEAKDDIEDQIKELEDKIDKMIEDRDNKCKAAKEQLVDMLDVTVSKYFTATGVAEALRVLRFTSGKEDVDIADACVLASSMASIAMRMKEKAEELAANEMDELCRGFYAEDVTSKECFSFKDLAYEMMCIDLCRNVGGAAEDMVAFIKRVDEELKATEKVLSELRG